MKVIRASMPDPYIIPADKKNGRPKDQRVDRIGSARVVKVDELVAWCKDNPDVPADSLALSLEQGAFG